MEKLKCYLSSLPTVGNHSQPLHCSAPVATNRPSLGACTLADRGKLSTALLASEGLLFGTRGWYTALTFVQLAREINKINDHTLPVMYPKLTSSFNECSPTMASRSLSSSTCSSLMLSATVAGKSISNRSRLWTGIDNWTDKLISSDMQ